MVELLMRDNRIGFDAKHGERIFGVFELPINTSADGYGLRIA
jgi:light-regulated signal transduction histidine kinase (bacteriophytochrome)